MIFANFYKFDVYFFFFSPRFVTRDVTRHTIFVVDLSR